MADCDAQDHKEDQRHLLLFMNIVTKNFSTVCKAPEIFKVEADSKKTGEISLFSVGRCGV